MELRTVDPRTLKLNPNNPRRTKAEKFSDAQMLASIKAVGVLQPPLVREDGEELVLEFGHRRVAACIKLGKKEMQVLVKTADEAGEADGLMGAISENLVRSEMGQVDRWRAMEALSAAGWNDAAIGEALGMTPRNIAQARLLANICPGMLDQMALNDLPEQGELRIIAAATKDEQAQVWKANKPKRGYEANWSMIAHALSKTRLMAKDAKFGEAETQAFGIIWEEDLFAPADEDSRSTAQVDAFLGAQMAWLEASLRKGQSIVETDEYGRPQLPKGAQQHWGRPGKGVLTAFTIERRTGRVRECTYTMPAKAVASSANGAGDAETVRKPRPDLTAKGAAMVGDFRTDALHQALREKPIDDDQLIAMLVLALAGRNVTVMSGVAGHYRASSLPGLAAALTEGGVLTRDLEIIRHSARGSGGGSVVPGEPVLHWHRRALCRCCDRCRRLPAKYGDGSVPASVVPSGSRAVRVRELGRTASAHQGHACRSDRPRWRRNLRLSRGTLRADRGREGGSARGGQEPRLRRRG
jgi:ParB family chromosome partitioning protein